MEIATPICESCQTKRTWSLRRGTSPLALMLSRSADWTSTEPCVVANPAFGQLINQGKLFFPLLVRA